MAIPTVTISPHDSVQAAVSYANGQYTMWLNDTTTGRGFNISELSPLTGPTSLEWIVEAPLMYPYSAGIRYALADFGQVHFTSAIANWGAGPTALPLIPGIVNTAFWPTNSTAGAKVVSQKGAGFTVAWVPPI